LLSQTVTRKNMLPVDITTELRQKFCYPRGGVEDWEMIRCARSDCYRGWNG
jgi:hypothetical protein